MNTKEAAKTTGLTYDQARYLIEQKVIFPEKTPGKKAHKFYLRDLVHLALAAKLRKDGFRLEAIRQAIAALSSSWKSDNPEEAGKLVVLGNGLFEPRDNSYALTISAPEFPDSNPIGEWPGVLYNVRSIAYNVLEKVDRFRDDQEET